MNKMPANDTRNDFPACAPKHLLAALREAGSERALSRRLGVNILYVSQLLRKGIEPTDQTEKGRAVRSKLFLPKRKPKPRKSKKEWLPGEWKVTRKISGMARETQKALKVEDR